MTAAANLLLLALILGSMNLACSRSWRWVAVRLLGQLALLGRAAQQGAAAAAPLLDLIFPTTEVWQIGGHRRTQLAAILVLLLLALGTVFLAVRIPPEARVRSARP